MNVQLKKLPQSNKKVWKQTDLNCQNEVLIQD